MKNGSKLREVNLEEKGKSPWRRGVAISRRSKMSTGESNEWANIRRRGGQERWKFHVTETRRKEEGKGPVDSRQNSPRGRPRRVVESLARLQSREQREGEGKGISASRERGQKDKGLAQRGFLR